MLATSLATQVLWLYIVLLLVGGLFGYFKAKSKVSLYMAVAFAVLLILCQLPGLLFVPHVSKLLLAALLVVFTLRLAKTKKFMPSGLMLLATAITLVFQIA